MADGSPEEKTMPKKTGNRYENPWPTWKGLPSVWDALSGIFTCPEHDTREEIRRELPVETPDFQALADAGIAVTWLGHASVLCQIDGFNVLADPVFCDRCSPLRKLGPKRYRPPPCTVDGLPQIHAVLISHNHYDHLDVHAVRSLHARFGSSLRWFVPKGLAVWFQKRGIENTTEMMWWDSMRLQLPYVDSGCGIDTGCGIEIVFLPSQHWSSRSVFDQNRSLWGSWAVISVNHRFYFAGDTGYCPEFKNIGAHYGPFDVAAIPIGCYKPRRSMHCQHVDPEEAVKIHKDIRSRYSFGIHWGTYAMGSKEAELAPKRDLLKEIQKAGIAADKFFTLHPDFTEMLRALGYPRLVSIENFRVPNFKLVAEILSWLVKKYDPDSNIPDAIDTEQDRVIFIKTASLFMLQKARLKINPRKLYQADGYAVQEMHKIASVLYSAVQQYQTGAIEEDNEGVAISQLTANINSKLNELRVSRQLAAEITDRGASLYGLLSLEPDLKEQRTAALTRPLELADAEKSLRASIKAVEEEIQQTIRNLDNIANDESTLDSKIEKKKADLERQRKRLAQLQSVRPAYMNEYEKLETELHQLYSIYVQKFRNLSYLEAMMNEYDKAENERTAEAEQSLRRVAEKVREEERVRAAAAARLDSAVAMEQGDFSPDEYQDQKQSLRPPLPQPQAPKVYGSMTGAGISDDEAGGDSLLSDDDDDDDDLVVTTGGGVDGGATGAIRKTQHVQKINRKQPIASNDQGKASGVVKAANNREPEVLSDVSADDDEAMAKRDQEKGAVQRKPAMAATTRSDDDDDF